MSKFLNNVDLNGNELRNAVIQNLAVAPPNPTAGRAYFDTALGCLRSYNGTAWINLVALSGPFTEQGVWNANTNTPALASGVGNDGDIYIVSAAGATALDGTATWNVGDYVFFDGTKWLRVDNTEGISQAQLNAALTGVTRKFAANVGDGNSTAILVNHGMGTQDVVVRLRLATAPFAYAEPDYEATDANNVTLRFATAPTANQYRIVVVG